MATFTTSALTSAFVGGASVFQKEVLDWDIRSLGVQVRTNVNTPQALTKFSADGEPRPYRTQDDFNGATFTDRVLTVYQSKYDQQLDSEDLRNLYLADLPEMPFESYAVQQAAKQYLAKIMTDTLWLGVRNGSGSTAAAICDGWGTIIAADITATKITPIATGAITNVNAVSKVELVANSVSTIMKQRGFRIHCSYDILEKYRQNYRSTYGFSFNKNERGQYQLDGVNAVLQPNPILGTSQRLVATIDGNLVFGTDNERLAMYATPHLNILQNRIMFPAGCQIRDLDFLYVNDQA